ncbi:MAG: DUF2505 domain-containing protein [Stenotrophobium sp.]
MKFEDKQVLDKPSDTVMKMYADRRFFERKYKEIGAWDIEVLEHEKSDRKFRIKCSYTLPSSAKMPGFVTKFIGNSTAIVQEDTWDIPGKTGRLNIEIKGAPVKISSDMTLKDEGKGASNNFKWTVSSGIPLIGGKLEAFIADDIKNKSQADLAATLKILADY